jgi:hypothetical protein
MTAPPLSVAEQARLDAIEAAPAAAESLRTRLIAAIYAADDGMSGARWDRMADAAIGVLRGPSSDAEQAVERCLALADRHEKCCQFIAVWDLRVAITGAQEAGR